MKRSGFTLIEVMVVLSILAIIAILAYNFFGGTMKEARVKQGATRLYNDIRTLTDAWELYRMDTNYSSDVSLDGSELVSGGYVKAIPAGPKEFYAGLGNVTYEFPSFDLNKDGNADAYIRFSYITDDICTAFNEMYNPSLSPALHVYDGVAPIIPSGYSVICYSWPGTWPANTNAINAVLEYR